MSSRQLENAVRAQAEGSREYIFEELKEIWCACNADSKRDHQIIIYFHSLFSFIWTLITVTILTFLYVIIELIIALLIILR